jgi:hypothetical protein
MTHATGDECGSAAGRPAIGLPVAEDRVVTPWQLSPASDPAAVTSQVLRAW